ncbi:hypothetical protein ZWY2020_034370, partial [Hordeum vulgare]
GVLDLSLADHSGVHTGDHLRGVCAGGLSNSLCCRVRRLDERVAVQDQLMLMLYGLRENVCVYVWVKRVCVCMYLLNIVEFWICLLLTILGYIPGIIYAVYVLVV